MRILCAFQETVNGVDIEPLSGEELEKTVLGLFKLSPSLIAKSKEALEAK